MSNDNENCEHAADRVLCAECASTEDFKFRVDLSIKLRADDPRIEVIDAAVTGLMEVLKALGIEHNTETPS